MATAAIFGPIVVAAAAKAGFSPVVMLLCVALSPSALLPSTRAPGLASGSIDRVGNRWSAEFLKDLSWPDISDGSALAALRVQQLMPRDASAAVAANTWDVPDVPLEETHDVNASLVALLLVLEMMGPLALAVALGAITLAITGDPVTGAPALAAH